MTALAPSRRWSRFSLATLFVVVTLAAIVAAWLGYVLNQIRQRERFVADELSLIRSKGIQDRPNSVARGFAPGIRGLFGDRVYYQIDIYVDGPERLSDDEYARFTRAQDLFPEADVMTIYQRDGQDFDGPRK